MAQKIPWLRVTVEGVVIVLSILLAFGIQAWWDARELRLEVRQDLENVEQELLVNRERVLFQSDLMHRQANGGVAMLQIMDSDAANSESSVPDTLAWLGTGVPPTLNASLGALDALIASGRLASVEDPGLRLRLAGLRNQIDDVVEGQQRWVDLFDAYLVPLAYPTWDNTLAMGVSAAFWNQERVVGRKLVSQGSDDRVPNSLALRSFLRFRAAPYSATVIEMDSLLRELDELLALLRQLP